MSEQKIINLILGTIFVFIGSFIYGWIESTGIFFIVSGAIFINKD